MRKPARNWTWKRLGGGSSARLSEPVRPDYMVNRQGWTVRYHVPHPTTEAIDRFMRHVKMADTGSDLGECWLWQGGDTFRVTWDAVTTPRRFIYEYSMQEDLPANVYLYTFCKVGSCCRPGHLRPVEVGRKRFTFHKG
jgi:hypothetical protein